MFGISFQLRRRQLSRVSSFVSQTVPLSTARLAQLRTASAVPLTIAYVGALRCAGYAVEAEAHRTLASYRQNGEWFNYPVDMAVAAISAAAYRLGEPIASGDPRGRCPGRNLPDRASRAIKRPPATRTGCSRAGRTAGSCRILRRAGPLCRALWKLRERIDGLPAVPASPRGSLNHSSVSRTGRGRCRTSSG